MIWASSMVAHFPKLKLTSISSGTKSSTYQQCRLCTLVHLTTESTSPITLIVDHSIWKLYCSGGRFPVARIGLTSCSEQFLRYPNILRERYPDDNWKSHWALTSRSAAIQFSPDEKTPTMIRNTSLPNCNLEHFTGDTVRLRHICVLHDVLSLYKAESTLITASSSLITLTQIERTGRIVYTKSYI